MNKNLKHQKYNNQFRKKKIMFFIWLSQKYLFSFLFFYLFPPIHTSFITYNLLSNIVSKFDNSRLGKITKKSTSEKNYKNFRNTIQIYEILKKIKFLKTKLFTPPPLYFVIFRKTTTNLTYPLHA